MNTLRDNQRRLGKLLHLHSDGDTVNSMKQAGTDYMANRGVSVPELRQIAAQFEPSHELALWLWKKAQFREMAILACMLDEPDKVTPAQANEWIHQIHTIDLAEQAGSVLFSRIPEAFSLARQWVQSDNPWVSGTAFVSLAKQVLLQPQQAPEMLQKLLPVVDKQLEQANVPIVLKKAISRFLRAVVRQHAEARQTVKQWLHRCQQLPGQAAQWVADEVQYEIVYAEEKQ